MGYYTIWLVLVKSFFVPFWDCATGTADPIGSMGATRKARSRLMGDRHPNDTQKRGPRRRANPQSGAVSREAVSAWRPLFGHRRVLLAGARPRPPKFPPQHNTIHKG